MPFGQLVILESQFEDFLACGALGLRRLLPVVFVHTEPGLHLCSCGRDASIVLMNRLNVFLIALGLLFLVAPKVLDLGFVLVLPYSEIADL